MNEELPDDLQNRVLQLLDGELDGEAASRLDAELRASPEARRLYIQLSTLHSALEEQVSSRSSIRQTPRIRAKRRPARKRHRVFWNALPVVAAAAVLFLAAVAWWSRTVPSPQPVAKFQLAPGSAFSLSHADGKSAPEGQVLGTGSRLRLMTGVMEANFNSGAKCVIQAPCDLTVLAADRISIAEGVAWFRVPPSAAGFTVELPELTVIDLGTEFGVSATASERPEVHVMNGRVNVAAPDASKPPTMLKAGEARRAGPAGTLIEVPVRTGRFVKALPQRPSHMISNGDLNSPVSQFNDPSGDTVFSLNSTTLRVLANGTDTGIRANEWVWSGLTRGFEYSANGGKTGEGGAFVESFTKDLDRNLRPRAVAQFARDLKATQGARSLRMDVLLDDRKDPGNLTLLVELYAWNSDQAGPELSMGGPRSNVPTFHATQLNDATTLLSTEIPAGRIANGSWETIDLGRVDLADGHDFYAWRIGVVSASSGDRFAFDNLRVAY